MSRARLPRPAFMYPAVAFQLYLKTHSPSIRCHAAVPFTAISMDLILAKHNIIIYA